MDRMIGGIIVALLFCGIGFLFARIGYCFFRDRSRQKRRCLARTRGTIVGIQRMPIKTSRRRRMCYFPVYEYTVNGQVLRVELQFGTTRCLYHIGDGVNVRYDANQPDCSYLEGYQEDHTSAMGCLIAGVLSMVCGVFVLAMVCLV